MRRKGAFNCLVATCIGEEGLDIPQASSADTHDWHPASAPLVSLPPIPDCMPPPLAACTATDPGAGERAGQHNSLS
jgi:hypothetical protein